MANVPNVYAIWTAAEQRNAEAPENVTITSPSTYPQVSTNETVTFDVTAPAGKYLSGLKVVKTDGNTDYVVYNEGTEANQIDTR